MASNILDVYNFQDEDFKREFFEYLDRAKLQLGKGTLPLVTTEEDKENGYKVPDSWFFDMGVDYSVDTDSVCLNFETKWSHAIATVVKIAKKFQFDFEYEYEEGSTMYGKFMYNWSGDELWCKDIDSNVVAEILDTESEGYDVLDDRLTKMSYELVNPEDYG